MSLVDYLSLYAIISIWLVLFINVFLSVGGYIYYMRATKENGHVEISEYPMVSVIVPAHNEGIVLSKTIQSLLKFDYPADRYEIIVVNDNSTDNSRELLETLQRDNPDKKMIVVSTDTFAGGKGKSNALNIGFSVSSGSVIAIYDADNTPEPQALKLLVENLMCDDSLGAVIGKFRTRNRNDSLLTRFVNIETLAYQCMTQAGRWFFFKLCTIPGTNFVIRRSIVNEIGGWDTKALSEDTEISFRIYRMGYKIKMVPQAVTWEQEPSLLRIWFKQRTRWAKGNLYVLATNFKYVFDKSAGSMRLDILYYAVIYVLMMTSLICSDCIFVLSLLGFLHVQLVGFSSVLWVMAIIVFVLNVLLTLSLEQNEFNFVSVVLITAMLFSYSKLWVFVVLNALRENIKNAVFKTETTWYKTERTVEVK